MRDFRSTDMVSCDACGRAISLRGLSVQTAVDGELQAQFFFCPHCGKKYLIVTTDNDLRETMKRRDALVRKDALLRAALFRKTGSRGKTNSKLRREINALTKDIERQADALRKSGEILLAGGKYGQENSEARPEKLSGD